MDNTHSEARPPDYYVNPVGAAPIVMGDPFVLQHGDRYYLYGTWLQLEGFECYESADLMHWRLTGWSWRRTPDCPTQGPFWATEVVYHRGQFYMTFSGVLGGHLKMMLARSDRPDGPYHDLYMLWFDYGYSTIDGHIFVDDGRVYLYFSRNGGQDGYAYGKVYGVEIAAGLSGPLGEPHLLLEASQRWEQERWADNRCNEGSAVFKHAGRYYMTYSANDTAFPNYGIGYATASAPLGPWVKAVQNPILSSHPEIGVSGPGHNSITRSPDGTELFIVYHSHANPNSPSDHRVVNIDRLTFDDQGRLSLIGPTRTPQPLQSGAPHGIC